MKLYHKVLIGVVAFLIGGAVGRYMSPEKVITITETKVETVEIEVEKIKTEYRTIIKEIEKPDGTKIRETIKEEIIDKSSIVKKEEKKEEKKLKIVINKKPQWRIQGLMSLQPTQRVPTYDLGIAIERRLIGPVFVGVYTKINFKEYGITLSMEL